MIIVYEEGGAFQTIQFDATMRVVHLSTVRVAEYPVRSGADRTDDAKPEKTRLTCDVLISDTPIGHEMDGVSSSFLPQSLTLPARRIQRADAAVVGGNYIATPAGTFGRPPRATPGSEQITPQTFTVNTLQWPIPITRVRDVYKKLRELQQKCVRVAVIDLVYGYTDMIMTSITAPEEAMDAMLISIEFSEVLVGDTDLVDVDVRQAKPKERRAQATKNGGQAAGYPPSEQTEASLARQAAGPRGRVGGAAVGSLLR